MRKLAAAALGFWCFFGLFNCQNEATEKAKTSTEFKLDPSRWNVAFLIMDGTFNTELTAPMDIFQHTQFREGIRAMNVFTVAQSKRPIRTFEGLRILPDFDFSTAPKIDILVVPSAEHHLDSDLANAAMIGWVKKIGSSADLVVSLCDGAFVLAKAGLLDGHEATTFPDDIEKMRALFPKTTVLEDVSFVHDQKAVTSVGGARSFEAALFVCQKFYGKKVADRLAHGLVIDWDLEDVNAVFPELLEE